MKTWSKFGNQVQLRRSEVAFTLLSHRSYAIEKLILQHEQNDLFI